MLTIVQICLILTAIFEFLPAHSDNNVRVLAVQFHKVVIQSNERIFRQNRLIPFATFFYLGSVVSDLVIFVSIVQKNLLPSFLHYPQLRQSFLQKLTFLQNSL